MTFRNNKPSLMDMINAVVDYPEFRAEKLLKQQIVDNEYDPTIIPMALQMLSQQAARRTNGRPAKEGPAAYTRWTQGQLI